MPVVSTRTVLSLVQLAIQVAPDIIAAAQTGLEFFTSGSTPTAAPQWQITATFQAAHATLQAVQLSA
jgi:hypothetical protein